MQSDYQHTDLETLVILVACGNIGGMFFMFTLLNYVVKQRQDCELRRMKGHKNALYQQCKT